MKMILASVYFVLLYILIFDEKASGFNIQREFYNDASDSLDDEQREIITKRAFWNNMYNTAYAKDMGKKIDGTSILSFQPLSDGYAKDSWNVYFMGEKIPGASTIGFQVIDNGYAKDTSHVYYMGKKIPGASPNTFSGN